MALSTESTDKENRALPENSPGPNGAVGDGLEHVVHDAGVTHRLVHLLPSQTAGHPPPLVPLQQRHVTYNVGDMDHMGAMRSQRKDLN